MKLFIFDFDKHHYLIDSFLESASFAHKQLKKDEAWFLWKFRDNPQGKAILACSLDGDKITGCVAYGIQLFNFNTQPLKGALSFETFVHPDYQRQGIFSKLIAYAENELMSQKVEFLLNFPNSNSLKGFLNKKWDIYKNVEYWVKSNSWLKTIIHFNDFRKPFKALPPNEKGLKRLSNYNQPLSGTFESIISLEYLQWRFFSYPYSNYVVLDTADFFSLARIGNRGQLREAQILLLFWKDGKEEKLKKVLKMYREETKYDLISFPISSNNPIKKVLKTKFFIKVPSKTNSCYKILGNRLKPENLEDLKLTAINFHTY